MSVRKDRGSFFAAALAVLLATIAAGCATETGRSTVGGLVYGSMVGTTIAPGIGSAIGAGVGMLAGALEGTQKEKEQKRQEEAYRQKFYRLRREAERGSATREGAPFATPSAQPSDRFSNLLALQENQPLASLLEREVHQPGSPARAPRPGVEAPSSSVAPEGEARASRVAKLHKELTALRRERRELEARVGPLAALLEEYDRSGQDSEPLLDRMEEALGLPHRGGAASPSGRESAELLYLQQEYEIALRLRNDPLAEAVALRFERLSGRRPLSPPVSSLPSLP